MKKVLLSLLALLCTSAFAQLNGDGYYRVQNRVSERYITVTHNQGGISYSSQSADLRALMTLNGFERVVTDPGSIIYIKQDSPNNYRLATQGIDTYDMVGAYLNLRESSGVYTAYASKAGITLYLWDWNITEGRTVIPDTGRVMTQKHSDANRKYWYIKPVNQNEGQYIGFAPTTQVGSMYYQTFYADFPFEFAASGRKAYYVKSVDEDMAVAVWSEFTGAVPRALPVILGSPSSAAADNKLVLGATNAPTITDGKLTGVYFNRWDTRDQVFNRVAYDPQTMRLLGVTSSGKLGFVKGSIDYIPHNTAYLKVSASCPDELVLMTQAEYDEEKSRDNVVVTAADAQRAYGEANPAFTYTITSGTPKGGEPTLTCEATPTSPVGTYPIVVARGGLTNLSVDGVNGTLTVTKAALTVTANSYTIKQNEAVPTFAVSYAGFKNGESSNVLTAQPVIACDYPADKTPGTYAITVSGATADNYDFSYVAGTLTIQPADPITVTANNQQKLYGDNVPQLTYTISGGTLTGEPVLSCEATKQSPVGTYPIKVAKGTLEDYPNLTLTDGQLTVAKAPLTITAKSYTIKQDEALPTTYEVEYSGFKLDETSAVLSKQPVVTCDVPADKTPGTYAITVSGAEAGNYDITYVAGVLTIQALPAITITANNASMVYADAVPQLTYTVSGGTLTGEPVLSCDATSQSPAGTYAIKVAKGTLEDYPNLQLVNGVLTITKAPLTVTAQDCEREAGTPNPDFELVYSGFRNNETESVLSVKPVATTTATVDSEPGEYAITVSGGEAQNYAFTYVAGVLTVHPSSSISTVVIGRPVDVYTLTGRKVRSQVTTLQGLPRGIYIVNGRKVVL